jgi:ATP-dependent protease HslVU (ClpYQ) peptidase subunit
MKWVKATERLPLFAGEKNKVIIRGDGFVTYGFKNFNETQPKMYFLYGNESFLSNDVEWLDDSCSEKNETILNFIKNIHTNDLIQPIIELHKKREVLQDNEAITQREANLLVLCLEQFDTMLGK